ncbi:hypothetical protein LAZ67_14001630 [Cordylochernes scorpioides]|uniref:CCHC-type domain-containing protein n=1 Tax=Cordylochernes scorpioides TaxID=51811 RepID=A0ABY6L9S1_9ARAC|nr:hypothetical protein LAZ67_14001630 [Cordylochernes scorpioides]
MERPVAIGGLGLLDLATQLQLACLKGVQVALRGGRNGFDWLVASGSEAWIRPPPDGTRLQPRRLRLLKLWEEASKILSLNHRAVPASLLLDIPIIGGCRFLCPPDLLAPARWRGARVRDLLAEGHLTARPTRSALADAAALGAFCRRLTSENAVGFGAEDGYAVEARRALDRPRLAATPISRFTSRWSPTIGPPPSRIDWASLRRCAHSGHEADAALKLALHALPHPAHPASVGPSCPACGSIDRSLGHRYWCCRSIRPLIREAFNIIGRPPDLQAWIFGGSGLEDDALSILASAKLRIYRYFVQVGLGEAVEDPLIAWSRTLQRRGCAEEVPERPSILLPTGEELSPKEINMKKTKEISSEIKKYANSPAGDMHANLAAARGDVTAPPTAASTSNTSPNPTSLNWADSEMAEVDANDGYTVVKSKKRRRTSSPEHAAKQPGRPAEKPSSQQQKRPSGSRSMPPQEIKATRANIAAARARQATTNHENYIFVELCPDIPDYSYLKAIGMLVGGPGRISQFNRMNGHCVVGLATKNHASRLVEVGLDIEGTHLKVFPFRKRAERIVIANLPGFVEDSAIVEALRNFGTVTSIAERQPQASSVSHRRKASPPPPPLPPQQPRKPAPAPATPASPVQPAKTTTEAPAIPSAPHPAEPMDLAQPAPAALPAPLAAPRPLEPGIPSLDHKMAVEKMTSPPSTPARGESALKQLLKHIEESPTLSIDWDKLPGLNCKDAQQLLTSETTMKRLAPTLTEAQVATLDELHETFKASCPDSNSTIRKTLQKTRKETNAFHLGSGQDLCLGYSAVVLAHPVAISGSGLACVFGAGVAVLQQRILWPGHIALAAIDVHGEEMTAIAEEACWIIGDFNIRDRGPSSSSSSDALAALLDLAALVDVATQFDAAHLPTRVAMHGDQVESNRLDRILVPAGVLDRVSIYATSHHHLSDHRLVLLQVDPPTTAVSSPTQHRLAAMLRSGLVLGHLAGYIRELEEEMTHDDDDGILWDRWTTIKAGLLAEARSLHDPRHAASDSYIYRARRYIAAQLEASSIRADYPSLPDLARAIRLRRPVSVIRDEQDNIIEGPELRRRAYAIFQPRFARPTSDPAAGAAFIASSAPTTTRELSEEDPARSPTPSSTSLAERPPAGMACRASSSPVALPSTDYRVLATILHRRLKPHLRTLVPECQTYAVPGRSPSWNIAMVTDAVEEATALGSPLAVMGVDLESAFDSLDRSFLESLLTSLRLPPAFRAWINILYAGADATIKAGGFYTTALPLLNGLRQGCASAGLWCGAWRNLGDSPLGASWSTTSIRILGLDIAPRSTVAHREQHLLALLETACRRWTPFTRGHSLVGRARAANTLVGSVIQHHLHGYLPSPPTIAKLQARLARFADLRERRGLRGGVHAFIQFPCCGRGAAWDGYAVPQPPHDPLGPTGPGSPAPPRPSQGSPRDSPTIGPPPSRIDWASLRRCAFSGHEADAVLKLAFHALPHPAHPASVGPSCPACGSIDRSLSQRYWCCPSIRPLIREAFNIIGRTPDLQAWIFGGSCFEDDALSILASAKLRIYRYFVQVGLGEAVEDPLIAWSRTLQRRALTTTSLVPEEASRSAEQVPERPSTGSQPGEELSPINQNMKNLKENSSENQKNANSPAGDPHVNPAAARGDVTAPKTAATTSATPASPASLNWADSEMAEVDANDGYTVVKGKKRRRGSTSPEHAARQPNKPGEQRRPQQRKRPTGPRAVPPQEIKATRANIADARARQATTNHENYVFVELCPDIPDYSYLKAMSTLLGGPKSITQFNRMNGHYIVGLANKDLANRLVADGLEIEGTSLKVFPFRKRAERIVVANLPGFVEDSTIVTALGQFERVTSIAPILVKMEEFTFTDGRREAFILLREGLRLEMLPTRLTIQSKGDTLTAFLSFGIKCSKCGKQGHRRANCPALARQGNSSPRQAASPTDPAPAPATPASPVQPAKTSTEAPAIPSAHHPAELMDLAQPAHAALPALLAAPRPLEPRISPLDHEMSVEKLTSPPSTPARGESALKQLLKHIEETPTLFIDWDKLPGLNCKEVQQLLTSETTMKRLAPTLTEAQDATLDKLHETFRASCPDSNSTIRKTLQKTRRETNAFHLGSGQDLCLGYNAVVLAHRVAISGSGLACVFGPGVAVIQQRVLWPGHIALATIDVHGEEMTAIAVHLAHEPRERNRQLELLAATAAQEEEGACWIIGDFNIRDRGPSSSSSSDALAALLDLAALVDVATQFDAAHLPTRVARHGDQVESSRLDRILVPAGVLDRVSIYATSHYHLSDHRLVLLQVGPPTTAVSSHTQPRLAAMLRSGLALEHLAGYIRELEEDKAHDDDDGTFWDRWTTIKAGLLAEARSLHDPRHAASDSYVYRARRYIAAQLEASSIRADYPSLPDLARAIRLRRPVSVIRDEENNVIKGPELRRRAFATFQPRFARPTSDPAAGAAFIASSALTTTTRELSEEDPLHRPDISPSEIAHAIEHLPRGKAPGWDGLPCELLVAFNEDFFAEALARVSICLVPKARGGRGLDGYRPVALPSADYRVLAAILQRLKPHLRTLVPECQSYAVPGRSPSWNIAMVTDAVEEATALGSPLAVMGVDRGFLESLLTSLRLPPALRAWINILYAGVDATIRAGGFYTAAFPLLNGLRQGCAVSAALFSIATGPLLRRLELTLGVGNVTAYADDIVLLFHRDEDFERVTSRWPLEHLLALLETAFRRWTPFTRGLSLVRRARAANTLVGSVIQHHLHGYLPSPPTIAKLQARLARFV